uniref:Uncharacterized protein n=1 Tax=viral metagenome TaxID=1070528 RepID=A0A6C0I9Z1_9ZZZZ
MATSITFEDWKDLDICECGGPLFKYHDCSKNAFIAKCGHLKEYQIIDPVTKKKKWVKSKKQPCKYKGLYNNPDKRIFSKTIEEKKESYIDPNKLLFDQLTALFEYIFIEPRPFVIQEIDYLVRTKLQKKPRQTYYFPTVGLFMTESHKESIADYHDRIFAEEIIDKTEIKPITITKYNNKFVVDDLETPEQSDTDHNDDSSDASDSDHESIELFEEDPEEYYEEDYFDEPE